ncbi:hypothetical protein BJ165DRAFT_141567 [Panaeolus papilionaceus]|nr:hypothetical protein BJ165DRAFT_141567 [Panaeolus papilionaceus]
MATYLSEITGPGFFREQQTVVLVMQARIVILRRIQIMKGNFTPQGLSTTMFVIQAIIIGTTYIRVPDATSAYFSRGGVIFFSVFVPALFKSGHVPSHGRGTCTHSRRHPLYVNYHYSLHGHHIFYCEASTDCEAVLHILRVRLWRGNLHESFLPRFSCSF